MPADKPLRRLPLRDLLTDAEKRTRDLAEHLNNAWGQRVSDVRDLSRPVRKKSHYPTFAALVHAIDKLLQLSQETNTMLELLSQELEEIHAHGERERLNR
jgi:hypothetical protein